ncbi:MAG: type II toxin-antitoxin system VapC family toxin [Nitrospiraceae bacterium]|nr:type II toxin-antitoxin system VapC family toxin [Nitrospiraceae bacterium]
MKLKNRLAQFLSPLEVASSDREAAAATYGRLRATLEQKGTPIGSMDLLIAAHALSLAVRLVTNNTREFRRVPGLRLESRV